jgi:ketosteroid isomerase-like protein
MYATILRLMLRRAIHRLNEGDYRPVLKRYADDATLVFPGDSSWAGTYNGKGEIEGFLRRYVEARIQLQPHQIVVDGWPWDTTICVHFTDRATGDHGRTVYENRGIIFGKIAWGKITLQRDYEDTLAVRDFDAYLRRHEATSLPG